jgi:anthranilate phosphoribosyltransferase
MRKNALSVDAGENVLDIVGTGGDGVGTVNISTGACIIAAGAGAKVAKHGNRSVSSMCGSADVLEELGVAVDLSPAGVSKCVNEVGMGFMFAPRYHPAMKVVVPIRRSLKVRTVFNILGPMLNPAMAPYALVGVFSEDLVDLMADTLYELGTKRSLVVHQSGLDELTTMAPAEVTEVTPDGIRRYEINPQELGLATCTIDDLLGGTKQVNAQMLRDVMGGQKGPVADNLNLNAGVALAAAEVDKDHQEGVAMAQEAQQSGKAGEVLTNWIELSQAIAKEESP